MRGGETGFLILAFLASVLYYTWPYLLTLVIVLLVIL